MTLLLHFLLVFVLACLLPSLESKAGRSSRSPASPPSPPPPPPLAALPLFTKLTTDVEVAVLQEGRLVLRRRVASLGTGQEYQALQLRVHCDSPRANLTLCVEKIDGDALDYAWGFGESKKKVHSERKSPSRVQKFQGIFGIYQLPSGYFLALIKSSTNATAFPAESGVREIREISLIKIPGAQPTPMSALQMERQRDALNMLLEAVSKHTFYFTHIIASHGFDVTRSTQSRMDMVEHLSLDTRSQLQWRCCDERFFWNFNLLTPLIDAGLDDWVVPVTNAWASSKDIVVGGKAFQLSLISRRSRHRQGQRYIKRGADKSGDVANFVETEQVLTCSSSDFVSSFVQVRGSIPLFWSQPETWRLRPSIVPSLNLAMHATAAKIHLIDLLCSYVLSSTKNKSIYSSSSSSSKIIPNPPPAAVFLVNLIDKTGSQGKLGRLLYAALRRIETQAPGDFKSETNDGSAENSPPTAASIEEEHDAALSDGGRLSTTDFSCRYSHEDLSKDLGKGYFAGSKLAEMYAQFGGVSRGGEKLCREDNDDDDDDDECGREGKTKRERGGGSDGVMQTRLIWFDYHSKCKKGNVTAIREIFEPLREALTGEGAYFTSCMVAPHHHHKPVGPQRRLQSCIIRTNCIDCLDRTNVVQTAIARWVLLQQLADAGALERRLVGDAAMQMPHEASEAALRGLWGDNGDMMSMLYAGTKALKRDVTRLGKRTQQGAIDDGINSAMRYYINNYQDVRNQRGLDIALGYANSEGKSLPKRIFSKITQSAAHLHKWAKDKTLLPRDFPKVDDGEQEEQEAEDEEPGQEAGRDDTIVEAIDEALSALAQPRNFAEEREGAEAGPKGESETVVVREMDEVLEETRSIVGEPIKVVLEDLRVMLASQKMHMKKRQHKKGGKRKQKHMMGEKETTDPGVFSLDGRKGVGGLDDSSMLIRSIGSNLVFILLPLAFYFWGRFLKQFTSN